MRDRPHEMLGVDSKEVIIILMKHHLIRIIMEAVKYCPERELVVPADQNMPGRGGFLLIRKRDYRWGVLSGKCTQNIRDIQSYYQQMICSANDFKMSGIHIFGYEVGIVNEKVLER